MKLNFDCIRDLLLYLEKSLTLDDDLMFKQINLATICNSDEMKNYSREDIYYSIHNLNERKYIKAVINKGDSVFICHITDITPTGHDFLQSIRPLTVWEQIKHKCQKTGTISFGIIINTASSILAKMIIG